MSGACSEIIDDIEDLISSQDITPKERYASRKNVSVRSRKNNTKESEPVEKVILQSVVPGTQTIYVKTWGCAHNNSDSEYMAGLLAAQGYRLTEDKWSAQLWLLNSCTVKNPAEEHFRNEIELGQARGIHVVVAGCVPQGAPRAGYLAGLSIVGVHQIDRIVEIVEETLKGHTVRLFGQKKTNDGKKAGGASLQLPKVRKNPLIEIIAINTGCLNQCTYCKTKHARGELGSYPPEEIVERARQSFKEGVCEIWLTSEDTGTYGRDIGTSLPELLDQLVAVIPAGCRLRLGMTNPPYILEHLPRVAEIMKHSRVYNVFFVIGQDTSSLVLLWLLEQLVAVIPAGCRLRLGMTNPPYMLEHLPRGAGIMRHSRVYNVFFVIGQDTSSLALLWLLEQLVAVIPAGCRLRLGMTNPPYMLEHLPRGAGIMRHSRVYKLVLKIELKAGRQAQRKPNVDLCIYNQFESLPPAIKATEGQQLKFLHVPVQSGSDQVLADMKREYSRKDFEHVVDYLRKEVPGITIATDIICGFPTETAADHELTVSLCRQYRFPSLFINQFFARPGTPAASMTKTKVPGIAIATDIICGFPTETAADHELTVSLCRQYRFPSLFINQFFARPGTPAANMTKVPGQEVKKRTKELSELFRSYEPYGHKVGETQEVLVTDISHDKKYFVGHNEFYEQVLVPKEERYMGKMLTVKITSASKFSMMGEPIDKPKMPGLTEPLKKGEVSGLYEENSNAVSKVPMSVFVLAFVLFLRLIWVLL
ncbi:unnamed protein product [Plutella xylostella]|uniref:tRNA (N(6)-L-threonylcarbamoyladenosine(37)-C(2))-methylthiotransferase n=1 Tax=Plutella xylostella TaxID=51655 RepID=A0A8S4CXU3_PLUXY|nr:unnamed protein product [Plutella xylostella]